jgi:gamma-tubulin complex component 5
MQMGVALSLFLHTIQPYLCLIDSWMLHGCLSDPRQEFFISRVREQSAPAHTPQYWQDAFVLKMMESTEIKSGDVSVCLPHFLSDSRHHIFLCGKSVELMHHSYQLRHRLMDTVDAMSQPLSLYTNLVCSLQNTQVLDFDDSSLSVSEIPVLRHAVPTSSNVLLSLNFQTILPACSERPSTCSSSLLEGCIELARKRSGQPFEPVSVRVKETLSRLIAERYKQILGTSVNWFMADCQLNVYFTAIRQFFFMEAGHTMHSFCTSLFDMVRNGERWNDPSTLNALFQHSAGDMHGHIAERLLIHVKERDNRREVLPIHELNSLQLSLVVPWPANIVISEESIQVCNRIFLFLLHIKRAKWSLDQWSWKGVCGVECGLLHKLQLLRAKLLHFVNTLHTHIMRRILHSTGIEFEEAVAEVDDIDSLADIHRRYVNKIHDRCLLNERASYVKEAIHRSLSLALILAFKLQKGAQCISEETVDQIDRDFQQCNQFLVSFLSSLVQRGSYPHCKWGIKYY